MAHGTPDWGLVGPKRTVYGLDDLGEHAVRLGSPHLWDRRGDVILIDTFEHGLGQVLTGGRGANWDTALEGGHAWQGAFCAKLTTGSDGEYRDAYLTYGHGLPVSSYLGLEFTFTIPEVEPDPEPTTAYWEWWIEQGGAAGLRRGQVRYDLRAWTLEYNDAILGWTEFAPLATGLDISNYRSPNVWHTGKLVIDYIEQEYVRFILNNLSWDLSLLPFPTVAPARAPSLYCLCRLEGQADQNQIGYVDAVIITQNEP